jgi:IclR helix-turn-helix domain
MKEKEENSAYSAPALDKGLDILETLCQCENGLTQQEIAARLGRNLPNVELFGATKLRCQLRQCLYTYVQIVPIIAFSPADLSLVDGSHADYGRTLTRRVVSLRFEGV